MESNFELKLSFIVVAFLAGAYIVYETVTIPAGGHPFGHVLGILGSLLMVMTELLYSARKRLSWFKFGQVRHWLSFHIFTGIVGPALVLMHTGLEFRGLAGLTMLLTLLVVASGFLGRYIYTAVPRTLAGVEIDRRTLEQEMRAQHEELAAWSVGKSTQIQRLVRREGTKTVSPHHSPVGQGGTDPDEGNRRVAPPPTKPGSPDSFPAGRAAHDGLVAHGSRTAWADAVYGDDHSYRGHDLLWVIGISG
jgi:hypothetical protein